MKDTQTRVFGLLCVLVVVWTATYWLYKPGPPAVTIDDTVAPGAARQGTMAELSPPANGPAPVLPAPQVPRDRAVTPPGRSTPAAEPPRTRVVPPQYSEYTVQPGDTMQTIARKLLGDSRLWTVIAEANPLLDARKLIAGRTVLRIPKDITNIQGKEVPVTRPAPTPEPAAPEKAATPSTPTPAAPAYTEYVVKPGDTLSGIAQALYGKSAQWRKIYEANKGVIDDPDHVKPGVTLRIPAL